MRIPCLLLLLQTCTLFAYQTDLAFPWATHNEDFPSQITINNPHNLGARVTLTLTRAGETTETHRVELILNPFDQQAFTIDTLFPDLASGTGFNVRLASSADDLRASVTVWATSTATRASPAQTNAQPMNQAAPILLFNNLPRNETGFAAPVVMNTGDTPAEVRFYAYQFGSRGEPVTRTVAAGTSHAETMGDLFPESAGPYYVVAESDQPLLGASFVFNELREPALAHAMPLDQLPAVRNGSEVSTLASDQGFVDAITVDGEGNLYVSDFFGGGDFNDIRGTRVLKVSPEGDVSTYAEGFDGPLGQAWDSQGNLYVSNWNAGDVRRVTPAGELTVFATGFNGPSGLAIDAQDNLFVANYLDGQTIHRVTPAGEVSVFVQDAALNGPVGIVFDEAGTLYVANYNDGKIFSLSPEGAMSLIAQIRGPNFFTIGYLTYAGGHLYATAIGEGKIYKVSLDGDVSVLAGTGGFDLVDGPAADAVFANPNGITAAADGSRLYMTSFAGRVVRVITLP